MIGWSFILFNNLILDIMGLRNVCLAGLNLLHLLDLGYCWHGLDVFYLGDEDGLDGLADDVGGGHWDCG